MMNDFYAYVHCKPCGTPFYVGKGKGKRAEYLKRNKHHQNIVSKYGEENILVGKLECSSEETAFELEKGIIKCLKRSGIKLSNLTDGGEGSTGWNPSKETRNKIGFANSIRIISEETRNKMSSKRKGVCKPESFKNKMSLKMKGNKHWLGRKHSPETLEKLKAAHKLRSEETRIKLSDAAKGNKRTLGKKCITDGTVTKMIGANETLPNGWSFGRGKK